MTYNTNVPNNTQSPGLFPGQCNDNFTRLKTIINAEHVFNDSAQVTDGVHRQMTLVNRVDPVALPAGTNGILYLKVVSGQPGLYFYDGTSVSAVTTASSLTTESRVTFNNVGTILGGSFNATVSVSSNEYTIGFPAPLTSTNLQFSLTGYDASNNLVIPKITAFTTSSMKVKFRNQNNTTLSNITKANLIIFGS